MDGRVGSVSRVNLARERLRAHRRRRGSAASRRASPRMLTARAVPLIVRPGWYYRSHFGEGRRWGEASEHAGDSTSIGACAVLLTLPADSIAVIRSPCSLLIPLDRRM